MGRLMKKRLLLSAIISRKMSFNKIFTTSIDISSLLFLLFHHNSSLLRILCCCLLSSSSSLSLYFSFSCKGRSFGSAVCLHKSVVLFPVYHHAPSSKWFFLLPTHLSAAFNKIPSQILKDKKKNVFVFSCEKERNGRKLGPPMNSIKD